MEEDILDRDPFIQGNDFFGDLKDYNPETQDDLDFKPLTGRYEVRIARLTHNIGVNTATNLPYDFYALNLQVMNTIEGEKGENRYLNKRYNNDLAGVKKLMNDLFTAGIEFDKSSREAFDLGLTNMVDKQMKIRTWVWTPEKTRSGEVIPEENRVPIQQMAIVKEFRRTAGKSAEPSSTLPF